MRWFAIFVIFGLLAGPNEGATQEFVAPDGWVVQPTQKTYDDLIGALKKATRASGMGVVTEAGPTKMAASRGITIPGNRVIGVFNNDYAVKILALSTPAMIEAPIRFYVTENSDGTGTLSYKTPSHVFAPYIDGAGSQLSDIAKDLDGKFSEISVMATRD